MRRMDWMDTLRGFAVVAVVVMHSEISAVSMTGLPLPPVQWFDHLMADFRMPMLVMLSGVLLPKSLAKGLRTHLRGKVRAILWPYAVWATLDMLHVFIDCLVLGKGLPWHMVGQLFYDPHTYTWFLAYLFAFHVLAGLMPFALRAAAAPLVLWVSVVMPQDTNADKFLWLFGWFLVGEVLARVLTGRVPGPVARAAERFRFAPLAAVGRSSLVYYASHMLVIVYAVPFAVHVLGLAQPLPVFLLALSAALVAGWLLDQVQHRPRWSWLFRWPTTSKPTRPVDVPERVLVP